MNKIEIVIAVDSKTGQAQIQGTTRDLVDLGDRGKRSMDGLATAAKTVAGAFGAWKIAEQIKDAALLAARYETLGVSMTVVGNNAGYTRRQLDGFAASLQASGIAMVESRQTLTMMAQAHLDLSKATTLSRIAQDAAVIGNINSSAAFEKLIYGIQTAQIDVLRTIGINVNFEQSYQKMAAQLGRTATSLTETEKMQARLNAVIESGTMIAGTYEAAMDTAGKQINSMQRYLDNLKVKGGSVFNDVLIVAVEGFMGALKGANGELDRMSANQEIEIWATGLAYGFAGFADAIAFPIKLMAQLSEATIASGFRFVKFFEMIEHATSGNLAAAKQNWQEFKDIGEQYAQSSAARWETSFIETTRTMYAEREANAKQDAAKQLELEKKRLETVKDTDQQITTNSKAEIKKQEKADEDHLNKRLEQIKKGVEAEEEADKEILKEKAETSRLATASWTEYQQAMDELNQGVMSEHQQKVYAIEQRYAALDDQLVMLVETGRMTFEQADAWQERLMTSQQQDLLDLTASHTKATAEIKSVWDSALDGIDKGLDEWVRNGELSADSLENAFGSAIRGIVADWLRGIATMNANSPQMSSIGGTAAVYSTMAGSSGGYSGLLAGGAGIANELFNPGAYASALGGLQFNTAVGLNSALPGSFGNSVGNFIGEMSPAAFGAGTAGIGTFVSSLLSGQGFGQAAASGAGSAAGFALGSMTPLGPIGGIIGSIAGSMLGGVFGGGSSPPSNYLTISGRENILSPRVSDTFSEVKAIVNQVSAAAGQIIAQLPAAVQDEVRNNLGLIDLDFHGSGDKSFEQLFSEFSTTLTDRVNAALSSAMVHSLDGLLSSDSLAKLQSMASSGGYDQVLASLHQIWQVTDTISSAVRNNDLSDYQRELNSINDQFDSYAAQLRQLGVDLSKYTDLEKARAIAIQKAAEAESNRQNTILQQNLPESVSLISSAIAGMGNSVFEYFSAAHWSAITKTPTDQLPAGWGGRVVSSPYASGDTVVPGRVKYQYPVGTTVVQADNSDIPAIVQQYVNDIYYQQYADAWETVLVPKMAAVNNSLAAMLPESDIAQAASRMEVLGTVINDASAFAQSIRDKVAYITWEGGDASGLAGQQAILDATLAKLETIKDGMISGIFAPITKIIDEHTLTSFALGLQAIDKELTANLKTAQELKDAGIISGSALSSWLADINAAAAYQAQDLADQWMAPINSIIDSHTMSPNEVKARQLQTWMDDQISTLDSIKAHLTPDEYTATRLKINQAFAYQMDDLVASMGGTADAFDRVTQSLREYQQSLFSSSAAPGGIVGSYQYSKSSLHALANMAATGDLDAMGQLSAAADTFLRNARDFNATASGYAADFGLVNAILNSQLSQIPGSGANTTVSSANASSADVVAETKALKEEMARILAAIVANTNSTTKILTRWDADGPSNQETMAWIF